LAIGLSLLLATIASAQGIDLVGGTTNTPTGTGLAKGNSYAITIPVNLIQAEFWLGFTGAQTLTYYVYDAPAEFGTYTQIFSSSSVVSGTGLGWYSTGAINVPMNAGMHYIIAVSWTGTVSYPYSTGDTQATSFGSYTHGYAVGLNPLGPTLSSNSNDQAIYHQRLTTVGQGPPQWQVNSAAASLDIDGVQVLSPWSPSAANTTVIVGSTSSVNVASNLVGNGHDLFVGFLPTVGATTGGLITAGGQFVNVNLADPLGFFLFGSGFVPGFAPFPGNYSLPLVAAGPGFAAAQALVIDPASLDSFVLSQAAEYAVIPCSTMVNFDNLAVGANLPVGWSDGGGTAPWVVGTGTTTSAGTGPITGAFSGPNYMYCETSAPNTSATFRIDTCAIDTTTLSSFTLGFRLSRIGASIGTLNIRQDDGLGTFSIVLMTYTGPEPTSTDWTLESIPFIPNAATVAFRFDYQAAGSFTGDIAIDDVSVQ
jgi:hypothetical protein